MVVPPLWWHHSGATKFEMMVRSVATQWPENLMPENALDPTAMCLYHGTQPNKRRRKESQAVTAFFGCQQLRWARSANCLEEIYSNYTGKAFVAVSDSDTMVAKRSIQAEAISMLHWCPMAPFLKPFLCMSLAFRQSVLSRVDEKTLGRLLAYLTRPNRSRDSYLWLRQQLEQLRDSKSHRGAELPPWLEPAISLAQVCPVWLECAVNDTGAWANGEGVGKDAVEGVGKDDVDAMVKDNVQGSGDNDVQGVVDDAGAVANVET